MEDRTTTPLDASAVSRALEAWGVAIGTEHVHGGQAAAAAATATFRTSTVVPAVIRPANRQQVERCVQVANEFRIPLYPVSSGKNWGYGSSVPVRDSVVLDLARLNRIVDFSEELAYVTVEPGVTQRQLHDFLQAQSSGLWMDATGSSPDCSIIGNTMERGFGHTPMGDHWGSACGLEVVLPTGECIETGFCRFPNSKVGSLARWGVGPSLDGLFSQSNLGIVTRMSVWLMPKPEYFQAFFFQSSGRIGPLIDALRPLRLNGTLRSVMHIGNDYKILSGRGEFPWSETGGTTPLTPEQMSKLGARSGIPRWGSSGALYGTRTQVREARRLVRRALRGKVDRLQFVDDRTVRLLRRFEPPYRRLTGRHDLQQAVVQVPPLISLLKGMPTDEFLPSSYWRKKGPIPAEPDPDRDLCGLLWCSPVAPNTGAAVEDLTALAARVTLSCGFEPLMSVSLMNERATTTTIALTYDRQVAGEDDRAMRCFRMLLDELVARGYPPYRLNICAMDYGRMTGTYGEVFRRLKQALDPNRILAPGRYEPQ